MLYKLYLNMFLSGNSWRLPNSFFQVNTVEITFLLRSSHLRVWWSVNPRDLVVNSPRHFILSLVLMCARPHHLGCWRAGDVSSFKDVRIISWSVCSILLQDYRPVEMISPAPVFADLTVVDTWLLWHPVRVWWWGSGHLVLLRSLSSTARQTDTEGGAQAVDESCDEDDEDEEDNGHSGPQEAGSPAWPPPGGWSVGAVWRDCHVNEVWQKLLLTFLWGQ